VVDNDNMDKVTAGSLVTLSVTLRRSSLLEAGLMQMDDSMTIGSTHDGDEVFKSQSLLKCMDRLQRPSVVHS